MLSSQYTLYILLSSKNLFFIISILFHLRDNSFNNIIKVKEKIANLGSIYKENSIKPKPILNLSSDGYLIS